MLAPGAYHATIRMSLNRKDLPMTIDDFKALVTQVESRPGYARPAAFALGLASYAIGERRPDKGVKILDTYYPVVSLHENFGTAAVYAQVTGHTAGSASYELSAEQLDAALGHFAAFANDGHRHPNIEALRELRQAADGTGEIIPGLGVPRRVVVTFIGDLAHKPVDAHDVYLRLHLLSQRKVKPTGLSLDGMSGLLNTVVWSDRGPFDPDTFDQVRLRLKARGVELRVLAVDKFPRMADYVLPGGVRLADAGRVRLGAYLAEGTRVMPEASVDVNAGTLGKTRVDSSLAQGVVVGDGTDMGGAAAIAGA